MERLNLQEKNQQQEQVLLAELKACIGTQNLQLGKQLHSEAKEFGLDSSIYIATALINMYAKCGSMVDARQVFDKMLYPNVVSWTALIKGYADNRQSRTALTLFKRMKTGGSTPNHVTFVAAIKACISGGWPECKDRGKTLHNLAVEKGFVSYIYVQNTLIDMYAKCGSMIDARHVFDSIEQPDLVSWNVLILGYAENGQSSTALDLFMRIKSRGHAPDYVTFVTALKACTSLVATEEANECRDRGKAIHDLAVEYNCHLENYVQGTLINMYAKCGSMVHARQVFDSMKHPDLVSWNALLSGYVDNGQALTAIELFMRMRIDGPSPDSITFSVAMNACTLVGALELGRRIHSEINRANRFDVVLVTCLVDFYAKCGSLVEAQNVFDLHVEKKNIITWSALLAGFSGIGDHETMFKLFEGMQDAGFQPNSIVFLSILTCCSHVGLVDKGKECFDSMSNKYGIIPIVEHYNSMLDNFGRANKLEHGMALLQCMSCSPNVVTWRTLLGACRKWKNVELARLAFQSSTNLNQGDAAYYVLMGQIYASRGMLQEQEIVMGKLRLQMSSFG